jgi:hypothetical protein
MTKVFCRLTDCIHNTREGIGTCGNSQILIIKFNQCSAYITKQKIEQSESIPKAKGNVRDTG